METQPNCVDVTLKLGSAAEVACHFAMSGDRLPNHTEGHQLNGRDTLSSKAGLRLGKDSAGVGVKNLLGQASGLEPLSPGMGTWNAASKLA